MEAIVPPLRFRRQPATVSGGFSLVEICLALGIIAVALIPLVGLLAVGIDSYHNANLRGRASQAVSRIASAIRLSKALGGNSYVAAAPFDTSGQAPITWTATTPPNIPTAGTFTIWFDENGEVTTATSSGAGWNPPQMVAMVILTPPTTQFDAGKAQIAVAWPANHAPTYSGSGITFSNPQGHNESTISFLANPF